MSQCRVSLHTLGCAGTTNEGPTNKGSDYITHALHSPANSGGLRMLYLWPNPLSSAAATSKPSRSSPLPLRPRVDFATLLVLPITAQSQSRLMRPPANLGIHPHTTQSLSESPAATDKCNRHRPVWQRPAVARRRRTGMPARIVSGPSVNACMAIMLARARGMSLQH